MGAGKGRPAFLLIMNLTFGRKLRCVLQVPLGRVARLFLIANRGGIAGEFLRFGLKLLTHKGFHL